MGERSCAPSPARARGSSNKRAGKQVATSSQGEPGEASTSKNRRHRSRQQTNTTVDGADQRVGPGKATAPQGDFLAPTSAASSKLTPVAKGPPAEVEGSLGSPPVGRLYEVGEGYLNP